MKKSTDGSSARGARRLPSAGSGAKAGFDSPPAVPPEFADEYAALAAMKDEDIDLSDIPEQLDWSNSVRGLFHPRPIKQQITLRLDAYIVAWFKAQGGARGYQTRINAALRAHVIQEMRRGAAAKAGAKRAAE